MNLTDSVHNIFRAVETSERVVVGQDDSCDKNSRDENDFCNGPLDSSSKYW